MGMKRQLKEIKGENAVALYHSVYKNEGFNESAEALFKLIKHTSQQFKAKNRILYLDIEGHRNELGGFDHDMFELQQNFILGFLMPYLTEVRMPLVAVKNNQKQIDEFPEELIIDAPAINNIAAATLSHSINNNPKTC
jgi:hypothetical protein